MTDFVFIDSGISGIPYMTTLIKRAPKASCVYVADAANFPYGEKSHEQVVECVTSLVKKICEQFEPRVIVVACNTMSVNALDVLRAQFSDVKFIGTVPAIKLASSLSEKRRLGLHDHSRRETVPRGKRGGADRRARHRPRSDRAKGARDIPDRKPAA